MPNKYSKYKKYHKPDAPDLRDRMYEPRLFPLEKPLDYLPDLKILDQESEGSCTGFGLAAVINCLFQKRGEETKVSSRMLYEMAKLYDEWEGREYEGSSCRGAIRGWKNMGVCTEDSWSSTKKTKKAYVTVKRAKEARSYTLGAYYRIRPNIVDFHSALNETGVIYASATVHAGWEEPKAGKIPYKKTDPAGHAFAIVGYNNEGFWVQNSWGVGWGNNGIALWSYEDWAANISDAWVVQLALPTPQIFDYTVAGNLEHAGAKGKETSSRSIPRSEICGHFVHLDDGLYHQGGRYWSNGNDISETADVLKSSKKYDHLLLYAHGGLNSPTDSAGRIAAMKKVYLGNRIYPYHFMYDTGVLEEIKDILLGKEPELKSRVGGFSDWWDQRVENITRSAGRALWREMKSGARKPFAESQSDGTDVIKKLLGAVIENEHGIKVHVVGHSTGAILIAYLLERLYQEHDVKIETCSLMAPAATVTLYKSHYLPLLKKQSINNMRVYNLTEKLEKNDNVAYIYRKSLLKLVSHAFEDSDAKPGNVPLLGMQDFSQHIDIMGIPIDFVYSNGKTDDDLTESVTESESHGGFDNDPSTMNDILKRVLGGEPVRKFNEKDLKY